ncbi:winged helix-turn-helix domain-containing protein [Paucibacter sp. PLA-PC-4]|uniref:ATP-binding protein n=1 Tax=Paucibacter sp. PLA-PC-4 TaxID=2993655 RepID=UPI00224B9AF5|nr:winged helix-turn-helix domain-containing protein [Paucibacter sp. PLA-PC-4]MCX2863576.1 winged helix-turn-helix domain-containing protein [Paucibacter sp. PLA-PC-4]
MFRFGGFEIHAEQRTLVEQGRPLRLGSRAFDLLVVLCRRAGEVVSNRELLAAAWPNRVVEEGSVRVHIANLRKALRDGVGERRYITNVPMRGYCLVAPVEVVQDQLGRPAVPPQARSGSDEEVARPARWRLPSSAGLVGRDRESATLLQEIRRHRCVTLVGAGGIGKTSVALPVARQFADLDGYDAVHVALATLSRAELVPMAIASALGIVAPELDPLNAIANFLQGDRQLLIVLDNCEHVIDGVAVAAEHMLSHSRGVRLLATSREALRIQGEWVQRLESLSVPPPAMQGSMADAIQYSAVQLFMERAAAATSGFDIGDDDAPLVCHICRRLDGIPLAIELAAGAIDAVGLRGLVDRLGSRLGSRLVMVGRGRRTALPRHQTLRATLDWSHALLPSEEQALLAQLSMFRGVFTHAAALAVFDRPPELLDECLAGLVSKSMVVGERSGDAMDYRLLETTREYAAERLANSSTSQDAALRYARYMLQLVQDSFPEGQENLGTRYGVALTRWIDDVREAVHWAYAREDHRDLALALLARSAPLWFSLSMLAEYRKLAERALESIDARGPGVYDAAEEMRLCEALGHALWHTRGGGEAMSAAFNRALAISERLGATAYRLRCRWGLWLVCNAEGDYAGSRRLAEQFGEIASCDDDPALRLTHQRMMALGNHFQGDQTQAHYFAQRFLEHSKEQSVASPYREVQFAPSVAALTVLARTMWLKGLPEQALRHAENAVQEALSIDHALSLCYAIAIGAAPVAFWCGNLPKAREWVELLSQRSKERSLHFWQAFGDGYRQVIELSDGLHETGCIRAAGNLGITVREALSTINASFFDEELAARAKQGTSGWCTAELLRVQGERQLSANAVDDAIATFRHGIEVAREQQALAWELRCSTSLARLLIEQGRSGQARTTIEPVLGRYREGLDTADLQLARALLERT